MSQSLCPLVSVDKAVALLRDGALVAIPTETVYGLGADASNEEAVKKIFAAKGRPADHPLIVHLYAFEQIEQWARDIPDVAWQVAEKFWPGPLTLILKKQPQVSDLVTGAQDTVGIRLSRHPKAREILKHFGGGVAAPSANRFGKISPTRAEHVLEELGDRIDGIVDGGACDVGLESTILDLSGETPRILRPGSITEAMLREVLPNLSATIGKHAPRTPGQLPSHYAPSTELRVLPSDELLSTLSKEKRSVAVLALQNRPADLADTVYWISMPGNADDYGREFYARLRQLDHEPVDCIFVEALPQGGEWLALKDRLKRAAAPRG